MSIVRNLAASMPDEDDDRDGQNRFARTGHHFEEEDTVVTADPRQLDTRQEYWFRRTTKGFLVAPPSATWHFVEYLRECREFDVVTPGVYYELAILGDY